MKKFFSLLVIATLVWGCSKMDEEAQEIQESTYTLTGYSSIETRTEFGTPGASSIPFLWSVGDYVFVGGKKSSAIAEGGSSATFTVNGSAPSNGANVYYNMTGSHNTAVVPTQQSVANTLGGNGDFGYATVENGSFTLNHATSYLWFDVTRDASLAGAILESITIDAGDAKIAGSATWNGSFGSVTNSQSVITLTVGKELNTSNTEVMAAAVVLPATINKLVVTYKFSVDGKNKYYEKSIEKTKTLASGSTYKISANGLKASDLQSRPELRVLTFEDEDAKFSPYSFTSYYNDEMYGGGEIVKTYNIETWSNLIPALDYGDEMVYAIYDSNSWSYAGYANYNWCDVGNTLLKHEFPLYVSTQFDYNTWEEIEVETKSYQRQGEVLSKSYAPALTDATKPDYEGNGYDQGYGYFGGERYVYASAPASGTNTFCVHHGYSDFFNPKDNLSGFEFSDGVARVIKSMDVANTSYTYYQLQNGFYFGVNYNGPSNDTWFKIVAYGYDSADDTEPTEAEFYLLSKGKNFVTDWKSWDLSGLGKVVRVEFNMFGSEDITGDYGLAAPAYFAYDNITVLFE